MRAHAALILVRHGRTQANEEQRYLGKTDESLSDGGRRLLLDYKARGFYPEVDQLFASPLKRCLESAEILYPDLRPFVIREWEEMDFGRFEYKNYGELKDDERYQAWIDSKGTLDFPEGERRDKFLLRCARGWERMCDRLDWVSQKQRLGQDGAKQVRAGAIVHGGTIMALMSIYGGKQYFDCQADNGRGYICRLTGWGKQARIEEAVPL